MKKIKSEKLNKDKAKTEESLIKKIILRKNNKFASSMKELPTTNRSLFRSLSDPNDQKG